MASGDPAWALVKQAVAEALDHPSDERRAHLDAQLGDPVLRARAHRLLDACEAAAANSVLEGTIAEFAAPLLSDVHEREQNLPAALHEALAGRYTIESEIGHGGMAHVYRARDERHGRRVAIKLLRPELVSRGGSERFRREIEIAAQLSNAHILALFDSGEAAGLLYYITPYVEGETLAEYIRRNERPSILEALPILRDVARALAHAHKRGLIHCDIKPANILLDQDGDALVADFGIARALAESRDAGGDPEDVLGTPAYMAPEQVIGSDPIDHRADLYSLGAVACELLTGAPPFAGRLHEQLAAHVSEPPPSVLARRPDIPRDVAVLVDRLLAKRPEDRPGSAADVVRVLDASLASLSTPRGTSGRWKRRAPWIAAPLAGLAVLALLLRGPATDTPAVLAIAHVETRTEAATQAEADALAAMIATAVGQLEPVQVIARSRLFEILSRSSATPQPRTALTAAALEAGADQVVIGELDADSGGGFRLTLRRRDRNRAERELDAITAGTLPQLADGAAASIAKSLGVDRPHRSILDVGSGSLAAWVSLDTGIRSFARGEFARALNHFNSALEADSQFAMAAYLADRSAVWSRGAASPEVERLAALALRATERDRLLIETWVAYQSNDPDFVALAESLAVRLPFEPDAHLMLGLARGRDGDFMGAMAPLRRVIAMDSGGVIQPGSGCIGRVCEAFANLAYANGAADSAPAQERVVREWIRVRPASPEAWRWLRGALTAQGRYEEAEAAIASARAASNPDLLAGTEFSRPVLEMLAGDPVAAERTIRDLMRRGSDTADALWYLGISLRAQGRLPDALAAVERLDVHQEPNSGAALPRGQTLFELARYNEAAAVFDSLAAVPDRRMSDGFLARYKAWMLMHLATVRAAAGDTAGLRTLVEPLRAWGERSGYGRDRRLHHHARALLLVASGQPDSAVFEFRSAVFSPTIGYTRTNYELGRTLLQLGRPDEAIAIVRPALHGDVDGSNLYVNLTDLHELLGYAFEAAGQPDSAATHFALVLQAWRNPDPELVERRNAVADRLALLRGTQADSRAIWN